MQNAEFTDPRLAPLYDLQAPWGRAEALFLELANETPGARVVDLGCGTGRVTLALAGAGHTVTGVDPARASLDAARRKPGAERVTWLEGRADALPSAAFDLALMTGHVAQFLTEDGEWEATLAHLRRALMPGGRLIFDSRDPAARAWETWTSDDPDPVRLPNGERVDLWTRVTDVQGDLVTFVQRYVFTATGEERLSWMTLRFRDENTLSRTLTDAGFEVEHVYGGWNREPVGRGDGELIVVARAKGQRPA